MKGGGWCNEILSIYIMGLTHMAHMLFPTEAAQAQEVLRLVSLVSGFCSKENTGLVVGPDCRECQMFIISFT